MTAHLLFFGYRFLGETEERTLRIRNDQYQNKTKSVQVLNTICLEMFAYFEQHKWNSIYESIVAIT